MNKQFLVLVAGSLIAALVVVGCGSSDDSTTTASITKAQFVTQGNAICAAGNKEINTGFNEFGKEQGFSKTNQPTQADFEEGAEEIVVPSVRKQIDQIRELGAPEGEEEQVEAFLDNAEAQLEKGEEDASLLADENTHLFASVEKEADAIGLTKCAEEEDEG